MLVKQSTCFKCSRLSIIIILICLLLHSYYIHLSYGYSTVTSSPVTTVTSKSISTTSFSSSQQHRKIIYAFPFTQEFEMLEAIFNETGDLIEKYIVLESNYSAFGEKKPRRLDARLKVIIVGD